MGRLAGYWAVTPEEAAGAGADVRVWQRRFQLSLPDLSLGTCARYVARMLGAGDRESDVLARAVYGDRQLLVLPEDVLAEEWRTRDGVAAESLADVRLIPPDDVAAAAARMNRMTRETVFARFAPEVHPWSSLGEEQDAHWARFEAFRAFYTEAAIRGDAVAVSRS